MVIEYSMTITKLLNFHHEWILEDIVHPFLLKKDGIMTKQLIPPGLLSHEELFVGAIFLQKRCNNMSFCHDIDCKTLCKTIEDVSKHSEKTNQYCKEWRLIKFACQIQGFLRIDFKYCVIKARKIAGQTELRYRINTTS